MDNMKTLTDEQIELLQSPLPEWALKPHPIKKDMTVIHPMAVIDRLNDVFGVGKWKDKAEEGIATKEIQKTRNGDRDVYVASCRLKLLIPEYDIHLEQFGGSTNDDRGDALKGSATDALTKCASYLGIGASIYKGQGNTVLSEIMFGKLRNAYREKGTMTPEMQEQYSKCSPEQKKRIADITKELRNK